MAENKKSLNLDDMGGIAGGSGFRSSNRSNSDALVVKYDFTSADELETTRKNFSGYTASSVEELFDKDGMVFKPGEGVYSSGRVYVSKALRGAFEGFVQGELHSQWNGWTN